MAWCFGGAQQRGKESNMRLCICVVAVVVAGFLSGSVLAAGGGFGAGLDNSALGGGFQLGNDSTSPYYSSSTNNNGESSSSSFWVRLDPNKFSFDNANWKFYTNYYDPSHWTAIASFHGLRDSNETWPQNQSWFQEVSKGGVELNASLSFSCQEYNFDGTKQDDMNLGGTFNILPSRLTNSNFRYWEGDDTWYSYPNGYENDPVITTMPAWYGRYQLDGYFVASTLQEAQAMGAPFVPEPATICLLGLGVSALLFKRRR